MALITCPECGKQISDKAEICVGCGYPIASMKKEAKEESKESKKSEILTAYFEKGYAIKYSDDITRVYHSTKIVYDGETAKIKFYGVSKSKLNNGCIQLFIRDVNIPRELRCLKESDYAVCREIIRRDNKRIAAKGAPTEPYTVCPDCKGYNEAGTFTCGRCGYKYKFGEYKAIIPEDESTYKKGDWLTRIKCPYCDSIEYHAIAVDKKFSIGKAVVGNTIGGILGGPVGAFWGTGAGIQGKDGKTTFVCNHCGKVWKQKI